MAKKSGTPKEKRKAPAEWQSAVKASAAKEAPPSEKSGVVFDNGVPVVLEDLTLEEKAAAGQKLGELNIDLRELEQDGRDAASAQRKKIKALKKKIADLSDEAHEGVRKRPAQKDLPGTGARVARRRLALGPVQAVGWP